MLRQTQAWPTLPERMPEFPQEQAPEQVPASTAPEEQPGWGREPPPDREQEAA